MTRSRCLLSAIVAAVLLLSGCAAAFNSRGLNLAAEANFSQIVREFEPAEDRLSGLAFQDLIYLCSAYGELKNYRKLFPCLESAQAKVNAGTSRPTPGTIRRRRRVSKPLRL